jgi:tRNA threonylcarbamoyladenosine biosynthesis protein TsaB
LRTACGIVQGLAFGGNLPVLPVITLHAMAHAARQQSGANDVLAVLDARMGEVYWAQYRYADGWQVVIEPQLSTAEQVKPVGTVIACGNGLTAYADAFEASGLSKAGMPAVMPHAIQIAQLGREMLLRGEKHAPDDAQPLYLRNKVALTTAERMRKTEALT